MKMKIFTILALCTLSFTLAGCGDRTTPNGTVEALLTSLQSGNLADFRDTLTAGAKAALGTVADMDALKETIRSRMDAEGSPTLHTEEVSRQTKDSTTVVRYRVVFGDYVGAVTFNTNCRTVERVRPSGAGARSIDTGDRIEQVTRCFVSSWE